MLYSYLFILILFLSNSLYMGIKMYFKKDYKRAYEYLLKATKENPNEHIAYSYLGDIMLFRKNYKKAIFFYKKAMKIKPNYVDAYRIAKAYFFLKDSNNAKKYYRLSYKMNPKLYAVYFQLGMVSLFLDKNIKESIKNFEEFVNKAPKDERKLQEVKKLVDFLKHSSKKDIEKLNIEYKFPIIAREKKGEKGKKR